MLIKTVYTVDRNHYLQALLEECLCKIKVGLAAGFHLNRRQSRDFIEYNGATLDSYLNKFGPFPKMYFDSEKVNQDDLRELNQDDLIGTVLNRERKMEDCNIKVLEIMLLEV